MQPEPVRQINVRLYLESSRSRSAFSILYLSARERARGNRFLITITLNRTTDQDVYGDGTILTSNVRVKIPANTLSLAFWLVALDDGESNG